VIYCTLEAKTALLKFGRLFSVRGVELKSFKYFEDDILRVEELPFMLLVFMKTKIMLLSTFNNSFLEAVKLSDSVLGVLRENNTFILTTKSAK
jgi:hypothetical protein